MIIITGCDSGIGKELYSLYKDADTDVIGTTIHKDDERLFYLNFLCKDSIVSFINSVKKQHTNRKKISKLFLNAGSAYACPIEHLDEKKFREIFEINFFANVFLLKELMPLLRHDKTRVCLISSSAGRIAPPFFSSYACSKFAVEALGDCLRREAGSLGIPVIIFEPRSIATPIWTNTWKTVVETTLPLCDEVYRKPMQNGGEKLASGAVHGMSAKDAACLIKHISEKKKPKNRYIISKHRALTWVLYHVPASLADAVFKKMFT